MTNLEEMNVSKPVCNECEKTGTKYRVFEPSYITTTAMAITPGYWDEKGKYHQPFNPNISTKTYSCDKGHHWNVKTDSNGHLVSQEALSSDNGVEVQK